MSSQPAELAHRSGPWNERSKPHSDASGTVGRMTTRSWSIPFQAIMGMGRKCKGELDEHCKPVCA